jgi:hypothetical protein
LLVVHVCPDRNASGRRNQSYNKRVADDREGTWKGEDEWAYLVMNFYDFNCFG